MLDLLAGLLLTAVVLLVPATVLLFGVRPAARRARLLSTPAAVVGATVTALASVGVGGLLGLQPPAAVLAAVLLGGSVLAWLPAARAWDVRGLVTWALTIDVGLLYLGYVLGWTLSAAGPVAGVVSGMLWVLELFVFLIGAGYVWELVDVLGRKQWTAASAVRHDHGARPFVSLQVPTHNEPPELVIETLERMLRLDYDAYEILVVDNNTTDPALWRPLEEFSARHERITFIHLEDWPGYKSGALNHANTRVDPRTEVIGIVDADYHVDPDWLARCAPLFSDPDVAFVQTPQDYRDWEVSSYFRRLYYSYGYFFDVSQRSRGERNGAIFGGTMGLIRRSALERAGGWDEWCITEDAEMSLRLLKAGGRGVHIDRPFGRGVMPLSFESLKGQRFRWCFGGIQILRMHWRSLLPGRRTPDNQLSASQRWAYLVGALQWFGDLAGLAFTAFLAVGALDVVLGGGLAVRRLSGLLLFAAVALVLVGALRSIALVRRTSGASWRDALGAFGLWLALGLTVARASWLGLVAKQGVFLRTPKVRGEPRAADALRGNRLETLLAVGAGVLGTLAVTRGSAAGAAVGVLLVLQGLGFAAAPLNSLAAIRSDLTEEQRQRRAARRSWATISRPARRGGVLVAGLTTTLAGFVALAAPVGVTTLPDISAAMEQAVDPPAPKVKPRPTRTATPAPATTEPAGDAATVPVTTDAATPTRTAAPSARATRRPSATATGSTGSVTPTATPTKPRPTQASSPQTTRTPGGNRPTTTTAPGGGRPTDKPTPGGKPTG